MTTARPPAVLFDLWGTLVAPGSERRDQVSFAMARDLGVDPPAFAAAIVASHAARFIGSSGPLLATLRLLARRCGGDPDDDALERAAGRRVEMTRELLVADEATLAVLDELLRQGCKLGLVTDSSIETPTVWPSTALAGRFRATAFSCLLGVRKPDPAMYLAVTRSLGVEPGDCVYVGDGDSHELSGAESLGMTAVRLAGGNGSSGGRYDDAAFAGPEIGRLSDLIELLGRAP